MRDALALYFLLAVSIPLPAQQQVPDPRFKADVLLIVAHPDDDTAIGSYLARVIFDQGKRVAVIFCTRGDHGGNEAGQEQAASLGAIREMEARHALATFGIQNVWFLSGPDTPSQDVLQSLESWHHGAILADVVRLVRITRPEVVLTWLPAAVIGENHGDHQAAGVIATEAFDLAGDPTAFAEQTDTPRKPRSINNLVEGLRPWQAKKLYYFSDGEPVTFLNGLGPRYPVMTVSPSRQVPYLKLAIEEERFYLSQRGVDTLTARALATGDYTAVLRSIEEYAGTTDELFVLGKSHLTGSATGDIFEGVRPAAISFAAPRGYHAPVRSGLSVSLGGPWGYYRDFWAAHDLENLVRVVSPAIGITVGATLHVPLVFWNETNEIHEIEVSARVPSGWVVQTGEGRYVVAPHSSLAVQAFVTTPSTASKIDHEVTWIVAEKGATVGSVMVRVRLGNGGLPQ